jgi:hypothetical protein
MNPHCGDCDRTVMEIQRQRFAPCERMTLPFDSQDEPEVTQ